MKIVCDKRHELPDNVPRPNNIWCLICGYSKSVRRRFYSAMNLHYIRQHKGQAIPPHSTTLFMKPVVEVERMPQKFVDEVSIETQT